MRDVIRQKLADAVEFRVPSLTAREAAIPAHPGKAQAVIGMRRAGKTWFLYQLLGERLEQGWPRESLVYFNFEDERLAGLEMAQLSLLLEEYYLRFPHFRGTRRVVWFFDEIQLISGWERFVRRVLDSELADVLVSGSSARMLSREVATALRGRGTETVIFPFSFREFLLHQGLALPVSPDFTSRRETSRLEHAFLQYLRVGGFPEAQGPLESRDRIALLQGYVETCIFRDVVERHQIGNLPALRRLVRQLLANAAGRFSVHRLYNEMRSQSVATSKDSLHQMLGHLEDAFLIRLVPLATSSERQRQSNPRKVYPVDHALARAFERSARPDTGHLLETVVALELERRGFDLAYVVTEGGYEVDFLATDLEGGQLLIQVTADLETSSVREVRALEQAQQVYPGAQSLLLTLSDHHHELPPGVSAQAAWRWLLGSPRSSP